MTRLGLVTLLAALTGCGSSDDEVSELEPAPSYPVPGCEHVEHRPCDVRDAPCQERLMTLAACLRGSEPLPVPPVTLMTTAELAAFLNETISENPPPEPNHFEIALTLLGVLEPGGLSQAALVEADVEFIWGIYRRVEKDVILVDHGVPSDAPDPNGVLVHEFVHALQDADIDLGAYFEEHASSYDSYLAAASVSEGEARLHQSRYWSSLLGLDPSTIDWEEHFREAAELGEEWVLEQPSPYTASYTYFQYELGARYVHHAFRMEGLAGVDALFASPPERSVAVMASESAIFAADWPAPAFEPVVPHEPWLLWSETSFGAWGLFIHLATMTEPASARRVALELRGDRLSVYESTDTQPDTALVWQLEFSNEDAAIGAQALVSRFRPSSARDGNRVVVALATGQRTIDWAW